ncbi:MAG TPA: hypothetical protein VHC63_16445 [Acidimicrobiales bacterium]|nr:hypothetical protein [Acidimicrobiales bacterium]
MRRLIGAALAVMALVAWTAPARAQAPATRGPLEDVTLRGRVLNGDGSPVVNTPVRVDAVNDSGFAIAGFFFTAGLSTLACFSAETRDVCPIPNSKRFASTTDGRGNYAFTFHNAHHRGEQTDTDYILSIGVASKHAADQVVVASYELELKDAVHTAPDLRLWDPAVTLEAEQRDFRVEYAARPSSKNGGQVLIAGKAAAGVSVDDQGRIDARAVEDQPFAFVAHASKDERAAGTIYHQRFTAAPVEGTGTLVPLSRGAACTATRSDGASAHCGYTDGDLVTPGVVDPNPCVFATDTQCQPPVTKVTVDLGSSETVGEVRARCTCTLEASSDGATWFNLPASGTFGAQSMRYVAVSGASLATIPEVSVWAPWPDSGGAIHLPGLGGGKSGDAGGGAHPPWLLVITALVALAFATRTIADRRHARVPS